MACSIKNQNRAAVCNVGWCIVCESLAMKEKRVGQGKNSWGSYSPITRPESLLERDAAQSSRDVSPEGRVAVEGRLIAPTADFLSSFSAKSRSKLRRSMRR